MTRAEPAMPETAAARRWLSIVGIGEDGVDGLSAVARGLVSSAEIVFGGKRHLALAAPLIRGAARPWPSPFAARRGGGVGAARAAGLRARLGRSVPLRRRFGAGAPHRCPRRRWWCRRPRRSASPRRGSAGRCRRWRSFPLHGRALERIRPHLHPGARVLALTSDGEGPEALARLLAETGFGDSRLTVLEALGGAKRAHPHDDRSRLRPR